MEGKVIGVPTWGMVVDPSSGVPVDNLNFALSGAMVSEMADTLIDQGGIDRPVLGLVLAERNASIAGVVTTALVIENVHAAQTSDLRPGDVVVKVNHQRTATRRELHRALAMKKVEGALPAEIYRDGSFLTVSIVPLSA